MANRVRCDHCEEIIGVYEPVIVVLDGQTRETSRAMESLPPPGAAVYHRDCVLHRAGDGVA